MLRGERADGQTGEAGRLRARSLRNPSLIRQAARVPASAPIAHECLPSLPGPEGRRPALAFARQLRGPLVDSLPRAGKVRAAFAPPRVPRRRTRRHYRFFSRPSGTFSNRHAAASNACCARSIKADDACFAATKKMRSRCGAPRSRCENAALLNGALPVREHLREQVLPRRSHSRSRPSRFRSRRSSSRSHNNKKCSRGRRSRFSVALPAVKVVTCRMHPLSFTLLLSAAARAVIHFQEEFDDGWRERCACVLGRPRPTSARPPPAAAGGSRAIGSMRAERRGSGT